MEKIKVWHGVYNVIKDIEYNLVGSFNEETRKYLPMCIKFRELLAKKGAKFDLKYNKKHILFTLGRDPDNDIEAISICHEQFDDWSMKIGENVVIGRIKRMRGDIKKIIYETEKFKKQVKDRDTWENGVKKEHFKTITNTRIRKDENDQLIVKEEIHFKPYEEPLPVWIYKLKR